MRASVLLLVLIWSTACTVTLDDHAGRACDSGHPCLDDRVCVEGVCRAPGEGACATVPLGGSCVVGLGVCASTGAWICAEGTPTCDAAAGGPGTEESCDGLDNDCNGIVDDVTGCMYTLVGNAGPAGFTDGTGSAARVAIPGFLNADAAGNLYLADTGNHAIRHITPGGVVTTLAGTGRCGFQDGPAATARFCEPIEVVPTPDGALYVSDSGNHRIRRIHEGQVTTVAGSGVMGDLDGHALTSRLDNPMGLFLRPDGSLLIADSGNAVIRRYVPGPTPQVETLAGAGWGTGEGPRDTVQFYGVADVAEHSDGTLFVSDLYANRLRMLPVVGDSSTIAGSLWSSGYRDGTGSQIRMTEPTQLLLDEELEVLYFADRWNYVVRALPLTGSSYPVAGAGDYGYADGPLEAARAQDLIGFARVGQDFFFSDGNHAIRRSSAVAGVLTTSGFVADSLEQRTRDGAGAQARLAQPRSLVRGTDGSLYWVDFTAHLVRKLTPGGEVVTLVGRADEPSEGNATGDFASAAVSWPAGLAFGPDGALYLSDYGNCAVRKLDLAQQQVIHLAGATDGACDHQDGALGEARFDSPRGIAYGQDASGQDVLYIGDVFNRLLKKIVLPDGPVTTVAGVPWVSARTDGPPGVGTFSYPGPIAADRAGNVWVAESGVIRHVSPSGVLSTPYQDLPLHVESVVLDGDALVVSGEGMIARMNALPPDPGSVELVFEGRYGWQDGVSLEAGGGDFESIVATPEAYYLADFLTGQIRQLWR